MKKIFPSIILLLCLAGCKSDNKTSTQKALELIQKAIETITYDTYITSDLTLFDDLFGVHLSYESSNTEILENNGKIHPGLIDTQITWSVTFTFQGHSVKNSYTLTVKKRILTENDIIDLDTVSLNLDYDFIDQDLVLPKTGEFGSVITWSSSHPHVISNQGKYYAPLDEETVTLTATMHYEGLTQTKSFTFKVKPISDQQKIDMAYEMLFVQTPIHQNIILSTKGYFGVSISWHSSHPDIIDATGKFNMPVGNVDVTLTATLTSQDVLRTKVFQISIEGLDPISFLDEATLLLEINHGIDVLFESITLPTTLLNHVIISWESTNEDILTSDGQLQLPKHTTSVTLIAHLSVLHETIEKSFTYLLIGTEDEISDYDPLNLIEKTITLNEPFIVDSGQNLTLGTFDHIMMKDNHLVLSKDALSGSYTSPIYISQPFKRINAIWGSITHENARTQMHIRTMTNNQWSAWTQLGDWGYGGPNQPPQLTYHAPNGTTHLQYKITLTRSSALISSPRLHSVSLNYIFDSNHFHVDLNLLPQHILYDVPQLRQADTEDSSLWNNICWATSISMVLQYFGQLNHLEIRQAYYAPLIRQGTTRYGTTKNDIGATQFGMHVSVLEFSSIDMLLYMVHHYGPIIVGVSKGESPTGKFGPLTFSSGHVVVVVGYEISSEGHIKIIVNDPAVSWIRTPFTGDATDFMLVWDKGGVLMSDPNK